MHRKELLRGRLLLAFSQGPGYGYDVARQLNINLNRGSLYRTLQELEADGMLRSERTKSPAGPDRRVYKITEAGKSSLADYVREAEDYAAELEAFVQEGGPI